MKPYENLTPREAWQRQREQHWVHLDVRTTQEFDEGHAPGAYNVPLLHFDPLRGRRPNERFIEIVRAHFAIDTPIVVSCAHAHRSVAAAQALLMAGFTRIANCDGGYFGRSGFDGRVLVPGWIAEGLPVITRPEPGRDFGSLAQAAEDPDLREQRFEA